MPQFLTRIALIVCDYGAITWLQSVLGLTSVADEYQPQQSKRWVLAAPPGAGEDTATLLAPVAKPEQAAFNPVKRPFPTPSISWSTSGMDQPLRFTRATHFLPRPARPSRILRDIVNFMNFTSAQGA